jgi:hypothetical protein
MGNSGFFWNVGAKHTKNVQHTTDLGRYPTFLLPFIDAIKTLPEGTPIIVHAASDGSQAYTTALALQHHNLLGQYPVEAREFNPEMSKFSQLGVVPVMQAELDHLEEVIPGSSSHFRALEKITTTEDSVKKVRQLAKQRGIAIDPEFQNKYAELRDYASGERLRSVSPTLRKSIAFQQGDILRDDFSTLAAVDFNNQFIHFNRKQKKQAVRNLGRLPKGSILFTDGPIDQLKAHGFEPLTSIKEAEGYGSKTSVRTIYRKVKSPFPNPFRWLGRLLRLI